jgi:Thioredoxin like C-terminal domain
MVRATALPHECAENGRPCQTVSWSAFSLIRQPGSIGDRTFEIEFLDAGAEAFAFTFG